MGGFLGIGGTSAKTDRDTQSTAQNSLWGNVFNWAMPVAKSEQQSGDTHKGEAADYFTNLLRAGRTDTTIAAAPALNSNLDALDAFKRGEAATGTGRTGGTAELNRMAGETVAGKNADIVNKTMVDNRKTAAVGLADIGSTELRDALGALGLSSDAMKTILMNATQSRELSAALNSQARNEIASFAGNVIAGAFL